MRRRVTKKRTLAGRRQGRVEACLLRPVTGSTGRPSAAIEVWRTSYVAEDQLLAADAIIDCLTGKD